MHFRFLCISSIPIIGFVDGTPEGQHIHDFIIFARQELFRVEATASEFFNVNEIENIEPRTDLTRAELRNSERITPDVAILRMKVVFYSLFLHEFSPLPIHADEEAIWSYMESGWEDTMCIEYELPPIMHNPWQSFYFTNHAAFISAFFQMEYDFETATPTNYGQILWARASEGTSESPFFNEAIYHNININTGKTVTCYHKHLVKIIWTALTHRVFVHFDGLFATPVAPEFMHNITSPFGYRRDPFTGQRRFHGGVDFAWAGCHGANIYAISDGIVLKAHDANNGFGLTVIIEHPNGWRTLYAHASYIFVRVGEEVEAGQRIALIGSTGRSTGPHLHFELIIGGERVDPMQLFR